MTETLSPPSLGRWGWVTDNLATGADLPDDELAAAEQLFGWREDGITHVLDVRMEWDDQELVESAGFKYLNLPMDDRGQQERARTFDLGIEFARQAFAEGGKVLA